MTKSPLGAMIGQLTILLAMAWSGAILTAAPLQVGSAEVDITPTGRKVHDPLLAKAIVFRQGRTEAALVLCDVIFISGEQSSAIRALVQRRTGIPARHVAVAATHTHFGAYHSNFVDRVAEAIVQAGHRVRPVTLTSGLAQQPGLAFNRRFLMKDGTVRFNPGFGPGVPSFDGGQPFQNPDIVRPVGPTDPTVAILLFRDQVNQQATTALVNFALHVCTCPGGQLSADFPYFLAESLKGGFGQQLISVFAAGTCGDVNHFDVSQPPPAGAYEIPQRIGQTLAECVRKSVPELRPSRGGKLAVRSESINVPLQTFSEMDLAWAREATANAFKDFPGIKYNQPGFLASIRAQRILTLEKLRQKGSSVALEVQAFRLSDDVAVVTLPGELFVELGIDLRKRSPFAHTIVIELANESCGYVPTSKAFSEGGYEVANARLVPGAGETLVETALRLLQDLK
jgi:neutral ceramidase